MHNIAIRVEDLGKSYRLGARQTGYRTMRETLMDTVAAPARAVRRMFGPKCSDTSDATEFWALRGVSFEVRPGECIGIIGRNGAGKSTLLKVLSRITEPTTGAVDVHGRIGSLLEVGTGFHPELTGRENIYLNGAILGMRRREIDVKFDEMVAFAEVERFLDTPVKRYSSGMYLRLAFAVAAYLEPEILVVDEVLAVGDAAFQKKCLGKMSSVASQEGRTVLFVSHNMDAILRLCTGAILLDKGAITSWGDVNQVVGEYLNNRLPQEASVDLTRATRVYPTRGQMRIESVRVVAGESSDCWQFAYGEPIAFSVHITVDEALQSPELMLGIHSARGFEIASCSTASALMPTPVAPGSHCYQICYPDLQLVPGLYRVGLGLLSERGLEDYVMDAIEMEVVSSDLSAVMGVDRFKGAMVSRIEARLVTDPERTAWSA